MKTAVVYHTMTGHSRKLAQAVAQALGVQAQSVKDAQKLSGVDLLFLVGGIYGGGSLPPMLTYVSALSAQDVRRAALITSCAAGKARQDQVREALTGQGIAVEEEEYVCRGNFLVTGLGHPNAQEIQDAAEFARKLVR